MRCAGIVTYNPEIERLQDNIRAILPQVDIVYICDNGSANMTDAQWETVISLGNVQIEHLSENKGIAYALNELLQSAADAHYEQIVLLDQDSVATQGMVDVLAKYMKERVALVAPFILDRNRMSEQEYCNLQLPRVECLTHAARHGAITSGSLVDVQAAIKVGGFDDELFIDYVDFDFNERLLLNHYEILKVNTVYLIHEKGKSEQTWLRVPRRSSSGAVTWQPLYKLGYSPMRCYYQARNRVIYWKKYHNYTGSEGINEIIPLMGLSLLFEDHRIAKLHAYWKGIRDGMRTPVKEYHA